MNKIERSLFYLILPVLMVVSGCANDKKSGFNREAYQSAIENYRQTKDRFMVENKNESPLTEEIKAEFTGLSYYPVNFQYRILADFVPAAYAESFPIALNNGSEENYIKHGYATFQLDSQAYSLLVLRNPGSSGDPSILFAPFYDKTNGFETYGGGRYLEPVQVGEEKMLLDFNKAYNPYCAYSPEFICPLPPPDNRLPVAIEAGEKTFEKSKE